METSIFGYLNESHVYTLVIYKFLIVVLNKNLIPPTQHLTQISQTGPTSQLSITLYHYIPSF